VSSGIDIHIIAERVAEVVNKKFAALDRRIAEIESRLKKLELDVYTVRTQTIESIVRSVLGVKVDDIASAIVAKLGAELAATLNSLSGVAEDLKAVISEFKETTKELAALKNLPDKIAEVVSSIKVSADIDTSKLEASVSSTVSRSMKTVEELSTRVAALEKRLEELSESISKISESIAVLSGTVAKVEEMRRTVEELKESVDYVREVSSILEERLKGRKEEEEEEEEE